MNSPFLLKRGVPGVPALLFFSFVPLLFIPATSSAADASLCRTAEEEQSVRGIYEGLECGDFCVMTIKGKDQEYQAVVDDSVRDYLPEEGKEVSITLRRKGFMHGGVCGEAWFAVSDEKKADDAVKSPEKAEPPAESTAKSRVSSGDYSLEDISQNDDGALNKDESAAADAIIGKRECNGQCLAELHLGSADAVALVPDGVMDMLPPPGTKGKAVLREASLGVGGEKALILVSFTKAPEPVKESAPGSGAKDVLESDSGISPEDSRRQAYEAALARCRYSEEKDCASLLKATDSAFLRYLEVLRGTKGVLESDTDGASLGEADLISGKSRWLK